MMPYLMRSPFVVVLFCARDIISTAALAAHEANMSQVTCTHVNSHTYNCNLTLVCDESVHVVQVLLACVYLCVCVLCVRVLCVCVCIVVVCIVGVCVLA